MKQDLEFKAAAFTRSANIDHGLQAFLGQSDTVDEAKVIRPSFTSFCIKVSAVETKV